MTLRPDLTPYTKIKSKLIRDLTVEANTKKLLGKKIIGEKLCHFGVGRQSLIRTQNTQTIKEKLNKLDFSKLKLLLFENIVKKMKSQVTDSENVFTKQISEKRLVFRIWNYNLRR